MTRPVLIARLLRDYLDYDGWFLGAGEYADLAEAAGLRHIPAPSGMKALASLEASDNWRSAARRLLETVVYQLESDRNLIQAIEPTLLVIDTRWSAAVVARAMGIPWVSITNSHWAQETLDGLPDDLRVELATAKKLTTWAFRQVSILGEDTHTFEELVRGDVVLVGDPFGRDGFVPMVWDDLGAPTVDYPAGDGPCAYVTSGSSGDRSTIENVTRALLEAGWRVVATGVDSETIQEGHRRTVGLCRALPLMASANLVVSHGGAGTLLQAMHTGVPSLVVPRNLDQRALAAMAQKAQVAIPLDDESTKGIMAAVRSAMALDLVHNKRAQSVRAPAVTSQPFRSLVKLAASSI